MASSRFIIELNGEQAFSFAAGVLAAVPFAEAAAGAASGIADLYRMHKECQALSSDLPEEVSHFGEKIQRVKLCITERCTWSKTIFDTFTAYLTDVQVDLTNFCNGIKFMRVIKYTPKFRRHAARMQALNTRLDGVISVNILEVVMRQVQGTIGGAVPNLQNSQDRAPQLLEELFRYKEHLMAELDTNDDGVITIDELWANPNIQALFTTRESLKNLVHNLFDRNNDGVLDGMEVLALAAALKQISALFYSLPQDWQEDKVSGSDVVGMLHSLGYENVKLQDMSEVAQAPLPSQVNQPLFAYNMIGGELYCCYEGFLRFYLYVVDKYDLWKHIQHNRLGSHRH